MQTKCLELDIACSDSEFISRARRFAIQIPISFRERGTGEWHEGRSIDISRTGILFKSDIDLQLKTLLEMKIFIPPEIIGEMHVHVLCWGPVIRMAVFPSEKGENASAAVILRYRFASD